MLPRTATLIGLTELAGVNYVVSTWLGTVVGSLSNFAINKRWAFSARSAALAPALGRFVLVQGGASGLHTVGVWALTRFGGAPYPVSKLVVAAAVYLASDEAAYVTGQTLHVNGGMAMI